MTERNVVPSPGVFAIFPKDLPTLKEWTADSWGRKVLEGNEGGSKKEEKEDEEGKKAEKAEGKE